LFVGIGPICQCRRWKWARCPMRRLRFSCRRALCGTWFASFAVTALSLIRPIRKNIPMIECFLVFSEVIAFICLGSQCAAVWTLLPSHRGGTAEAGATRADRVGEASISRFAPPTSRRTTTTESWGLSLPLRSPQWLLGSQPQRVPDFGSGRRPHYMPGEPLHCRIEESPPCSNAGSAHDPAVMQTIQTTTLPGDAFIGGNRLFAGLVLHQVRPCDRSAAAPKQPINSSRNPNPSPVSVPGPNAGSVFTPGCEQPLRIAQAAWSGPPLAPIETLFSELARRRLRSLAPEKKRA